MECPLLSGGTLRRTWQGGVRGGFCCALLLPELKPPPSPSLCGVWSDPHAGGEFTYQGPSCPVHPIAFMSWIRDPRNGSMEFLTVPCLPIGLEEREPNAGREPTPPMIDPSLLVRGQKPIPSDHQPDLQALPLNHQADR